MKHEDTDNKIGMPDVDKEWAKFEAEVIDNRRIGQHPKRLLSRAASIALLLTIGLVGLASTYYIIQAHEEPSVPLVNETADVPIAAEAVEAGTEETEFDMDSEEQTFDNVELQEIVRYLQLRYNIQPHFADEEAKHIRLYVTIGKEESLSEVVALLNNFQMVQFRMENDRLIVE